MNEEIEDSDEELSDGEMEETVPEEGPYRREYRIGKFWKVILFIAAPALIALSAWLVVMALQSMKPVELIIYLPIAAGLTFVSIFGFIDAIIGKVILTNENITLVSSFGTRTLHGQEIKAYQTDDNYIIVLPQAGKKKIKISKYFARSYEITYWLQERANDHNKLKKFEEEQEVLKNEEYGITEESRAARFAMAKKVAKVINFIAWPLAAWLLFSPRPYGTAIIAGVAFPLVIMTISYLFRGLIKGDERQDSAYPSMVLAFALTTASLMLRAILDFEILDYSKLWTVVAIIAIGLLVLYFVPEGGIKFKTGSQIGMVLSTVLFMFFYSLGVSILMNCMMDKSQPQDFKTTVTKKYISTGRMKTGHFVLAPWDNNTEPVDVQVSTEQYRNSEVGDTVVITQFNGYLKAKWIEVSNF